MKQRLTVEVYAQTAALLAMLDEQGNAEAVLLELVARAVDGVGRPGSWERAWLRQAFGTEWEERLMTDPELHWRQRPR